MSNVPITDAASATRKVDTIQRTDGADTVETQAVAVINPTTGTPLLPDGDGAMPVTMQSLPLPSGAATQTTLAALNVIAAAVQAAVEAINGKTTAINTGAIAGTVALDAPTLAALESITASTGGLTDAQLRAAALPVSAADLPLPTGAATEATLATLAGAVGSHDAVAVDGRQGMVMLAKRRDSDGAAMVADGDLAFLSVDEQQRLKVSTQPASYVVGLGSITANAQTVVLNVERASNVTINMVATTLVGHNATFEYSHNSTNGSDGNWYGVQAVRSNANTVETATGVLAATPAYGWELSVNAYKWVRVRATAHTSGTAAYVITPGAYATEPIPAVQVTGTQPVSGTVTATVTAGTVNPVVPATPYILNSAATTNEVLILTGTSGLQCFYATNTGATAAFVKLYNKATAPISTDVPAMILPVPAAVSGVPGVCTLPIGFSGFRFALGLGIRITGAVADTDTTAVAAGQVKVMLSRTV